MQAAWATPLAACVFIINALQCTKERPVSGTVHALACHGDFRTATARRACRPGRRALMPKLPPPPRSSGPQWRADPCPRAKARREYCRREGGRPRVRGKAATRKEPAVPDRARARRVARRVGRVRVSCTDRACRPIAAVGRLPPKGRPLRRPAAAAACASAGLQRAAASRLMLQEPFAAAGAGRCRPCARR